MDKHYDTLIVGAGAAGLMAGITAARRAGAGRIVALATTLPRHTLATQTEADVVIDDFASITDLNTLLL